MAGVLARDNRESFLYDGEMADPTSVWPSPRGTTNGPQCEARASRFRKHPAPGDETQFFRSVSIAYPNLNGINEYTYFVLFLKLRYVFIRCWERDTSVVVFILYTC
jgi:hypothetical protein